MEKELVENRIEIRKLHEDVSTGKITADDAKKKLEELRAKKAEIEKRIALQNTPRAKTETATNFADIKKAMVEQRAVTLSGTGAINQVQSLVKELQVKTPLLQRVRYFYGPNASTNLGGGKYNIEQVRYYYRIAAANTDTGYMTPYSNSKILIATATSAVDILNNSIGWDQILPGSIRMNKLGVDQLIAKETNLAIITNDSNLQDKNRRGFQYWALDNYQVYNPDGSITNYNKGEFRINTNVDDYIIVDPYSGISFKASKFEMDALGSHVYGDFSVYDKRDGKKYLFIDILEDSGDLKDYPVITIGNNTKNATINVYGTMFVNTPTLPPFPPNIVF